MMAVIVSAWRRNLPEADKREATRILAGLNEFRPRE